MCTYARLGPGCYRTHPAAIGGPGIATPLAGSAFQLSVNLVCHLPDGDFRSDPLSSLLTRPHELPVVAGLQAGARSWLAHRCAAPRPPSLSCELSCFSQLVVAVQSGLWQIGLGGTCAQVPHHSSAPSQQGRLAHGAPFAFERSQAGPMVTFCSVQGWIRPARPLGSLQLLLTGPPVAGCPAAFQ